MAVWLCYSARTSTDKILSVIFPVTAFVAAGFEHAIANMYFVPIGLETNVIESIPLDPSSRQPRTLPSPLHGDEPD
jgi:formate/nitrite transporter FocA (FNT family)